MFLAGLTDDALTSKETAAGFEWGTGMIFSSLPFQLRPPPGQQIQEKFANATIEVSSKDAY